MKIVKYERIILSPNEYTTLINFDNILTGLARGTENPEIEKLILEIQEKIADLEIEVEVEE